MQSKRKKFWIVFGVVIACLVIVLVVFSFVFRLKTVDVELRARVEQPETKLPDQVREKVLEAGEFKYNSNMFFYNTNDCVAKIEKKIPYVKVEQVIKYFPSVVRVYITERHMKYRVQDKTSASTWYILDEDFKVLEIVSEINITDDSDYFQKTIMICPSSFKLESVSAGDFLTNSGESAKINKQIQGYVNDAATGIYGRTKDIGKVLQIKFASLDQDFKLELTMKDKNVKIVIDGKDNITQKVFCGVSLFYDENMVINQEIDENSIIEVGLNPDGKGYEAIVKNSAS